MDEGEVPQRTRARRGIYLLPNLFTTAALFAGFYAIVAAMNGDFTRAAAAVFAAMLLDGMDGRIARMTNTQSAFGAQYDSLSDVISFGLAPALVAYEWGLSEFGRIGWVVAFLYAVCAALRLARFNTQLGTADKRYFQGLPSPAAAALVAGFIWCAHDLGWTSTPAKVGGVVCTVLGGLLMVSNVRFSSFKELDLRGRVPFVAILVAVAVMLLIMLDPPRVLFFAALGFALSGPVLTLTRLRSHREARRKPPG